jgi:hypothetical protein
MDSKKWVKGKPVHVPLVVFFLYISVFYFLNPIPLISFQIKFE